jgi:hypothetical protein
MPFAQCRGGQQDDVNVVMVIKVGKRRIGLARNPAPTPDVRGSPQASNDGYRLQQDERLVVGIASLFS